jgi:hypothetical protein
MKKFAFISLCCSPILLAGVSVGSVYGIKAITAKRPAPSLEFKFGNLLKKIHVGENKIDGQYVGNYYFDISGQLVLTDQHDKTITATITGENE